MWVFLEIGFFGVHMKRIIYSGGSGNCQVDMVKSCYKSPKTAAV